MSAPPRRPEPRAVSSLKKYLLKIGWETTEWESTAERHYPVNRDHAAAASLDMLERRTTDNMKLHWECFNHCTANFFAYVTNLKLPRPISTPTPTRAGPKILRRGSSN